MNFTADQCQGRIVQTDSIRKLLNALLFSVLNFYITRFRRIHAAPFYRRMDECKKSRIFRRTRVAVPPKAFRDFSQKNKLLTRFSKRLKRFTFWLLPRSKMRNAKSPSRSTRPSFYDNVYTRSF